MSRRCNSLLIRNLHFYELASSIATTSTGKLMISWVPDRNVAIASLHFATSMSIYQANPTLAAAMVVINQASPFYSADDPNNCVMAHFGQNNSAIGPMSQTGVLTYSDEDGLLLKTGQPISLYAMMQNNGSGAMNAHLSIQYYYVK